MSAVETAAIDRTALTKIVRAATGPGVELADWHTESLKETGDFVTGGVYRLSGVGRGRQKPRPWSVVLKAIHATSATAHLPPAHPDYWRREALAYHSGLLDDLPVGLTAARCFGVEYPAPDTAWLWLEDITDRFGGRWPLPDRLLVAASHLGRFNGAYLAGKPLPDYPWLSREDAREWVERGAERVLDAIRDPATWRLPALQRAFPVPVKDGLLRVWEERERLLVALDRLPQTLCHRDPLVPLNLLARQRLDGEDETVAIDWAAVGVGAVGEDFALFIEGSGLRRLLTAAGHPAEMRDALRLRQQAFAAYLTGLGDAGWAVDERAVRVGYLASAVLQRTFAAVGRAFHQATVEAPDEAELESAAALIYFRLEQTKTVREILPPD